MRLFALFARAGNGQAPFAPCTAPHMLKLVHLGTHRTLARGASVAPDHLRYPALVISRKDLQLIGHLSSVGFAFVLAIVLGFGGGYLLDEWLGTRPWLSFLGFFLGLAAGILNVYRIMQIAQKK